MPGCTRIPEHTHTPACTYATTCTRWSNYRHFNHWTLLLWGTADIAGGGQKKRPLTDFNLGLMIVDWAWLLCCSNYGRCHFLSGSSGRIKDTRGCLDWIKAAFFKYGRKNKDTRECNTCNLMDSELSNNDQYLNRWKVSFQPWSLWQYLIYVIRSMATNC